jgi:bile acid:Na+ symporter, BASS family
MILLAQTVTVVLIPVLAGLSIRSFFPGLARKFLPVAPLVAVVFLLVLIGGTVANMQPAMLRAGLLLLAAIGTVHVLGAILGYLLGLLFSRNEVVSRTVAIEVSMQNAGIGIALAKSGAFASPLVVLPSIFSGLWSCLIGSILAAIWSRVPVTVPAGSPDTPSPIVPAVD